MFVNVLDFVWNNFFIISILVMLILYYKFEGVDMF